MADAGHPENGWHEASPWYDWGPYLSERAWGSVREDYSASGDAWNGSRTTTPGRAPTAGTKTAWRA